MNARPDWTDMAEMVHQRVMRVEDQRAEDEQEVTNEISDTMQRALCRGEAVGVPGEKSGRGFAEDKEIDARALDILWDHLSDDRATPLLLALLRTNTPEAQALVEYAAVRHAWFNAEDIANIREREAMEP